MANVQGAARARLQQAAVALFQERGFDRTTAAEIAAHAGVTERTFFRHFADKREVLFDGQAVLLEALLTAIADAPCDLPPLSTLFRAFHAVRGLLEANRPFAKPRYEVIAATPALQERELSKIAALIDALAQALLERGVPALQAILAAQTGMAAFAHATTAWLDDADPGLAERFDAAQRELKELLKSEVD
jgi:AcrR family transcriptional regulator